MINFKKLVAVNCRKKLQYIQAELKCKNCATNAIFAKIGHIASEEVTLQLTKSKCLPVLLYGLEACPSDKSTLLSLDFVINRFFMKLFMTRNINVVKQLLQANLGIDILSVLWAKRVFEL